MSAVVAENESFIPTNAEDLRRCLADPVWRLSNLYKIIVKDDDEDDSEGTVMQFRPNRAQRRFIARLWHRNIILKARQLGFTTLICILWLDHALFNPNQRCGVVAQTDEIAMVIFRDKVAFAYDSLPEHVKAMFPTKARNDHEILFKHNNSSVRVAASMRGGTIHRLLISEYGKICAQFPKRAIEVQTGSLPAVPLNGIAVIESTAEGQSGDFKKRCDRAEALAQRGVALSAKDFRFHFYAWWQEPKYRMAAELVTRTREDDEYVDETEVEIGQQLHPDQWAWYFATKHGELSGNDETMWREYPSYPAEAFKVSTEGAYYAKQLTAVRKDRRICPLPYLTGSPVHTFWDLGLNDRQAIWFGQQDGPWFNWIDFYENEGEGVSHYARILQERGYVYGSHYLPHDGAHRRVTIDKPQTYEQLMRQVGIKNTIIVPRVSHITTGIDKTREAFSRWRFDDKKCAKGLLHLAEYKKQWNTSLGTWGDHPRHDEHSNAADAIRQQAQGYKNVGPKKPKAKPSWRTA